MNQAEFSKHIGKSRTTVTRFKKEGLLVIGTNGIDAEKSIKKLIASGRLEQPQKPKPTQPIERVGHTLKKPIQPRQEQLTDIEIVSQFYGEVIKRKLQEHEQGFYGMTTYEGSYDGENKKKGIEWHNTTIKGLEFNEQFRERFRKDLKRFAKMIRNKEELGELNHEYTDFNFSTIALDEDEEFIWSGSSLSFTFDLGYWDIENPTEEERELLKLHPHTYTP